MLVSVILIRIVLTSLYSNDNSFSLLCCNDLRKQKSFFCLQNMIGGSVVGWRRAKIVSVCASELLLWSVCASICLSTSRPDVSHAAINPHKHMHQQHQPYQHNNRDRGHNSVPEFRDTTTIDIATAQVETKRINHHDIQILESSIPCFCCQQCWRCLGLSPRQSSRSVGTTATKYAMEESIIIVVSVERPSISRWTRTKNQSQ